jgi:MFS family permease
MKLDVFIPYLTARCCFSLAGTMLTVAIGWHLYQLTGDPFDLALVGLVQLTPILSLFIFTGWVIDNFSRKLIVILCALTETLVLLGIALVMQQEEIQKVFLLSLLFVHGSVRAFYMPAQQAILPNIVSETDLPRAVAITSTVWNVASTSGPFVAGLLLAWIDFSIYWVLCVLTIASTLLFFRLPKLPRVKSIGRGWEQILGGIRFVKTSPYVLGAITLDLFIVLVGSVMALLPIYVTDVLEVGPEALGLLRAMPALGAVIVGVMLAKLPPLRNAGHTLFASLVVFSFSILLFAWSEILWLSMLALFIYGGTDMVSVNIRTTLVQLATPNELRGRVSAVNTIFISTSNDMGDFRAGSVAALLPPVATATLGGIMALGVAVGGFFLFPKIRQLKKLKDASYKPETDKSR